MWARKRAFALRPIVGEADHRYDSNQFAGVIDDRPARVPEPEQLRDPTAARHLCEAAIDVLAAIHSVPWRGRDLPGRPGGYLQRQLKRWSGQRALTPSADRLAGLDRVGGWLRENMPEDGETTIVAWL